MSLIFPQFRAGKAASGPPSALTVELRPSGPFWQNTARTTPAGVGDPVRVWDDSSGNGLHAVAPSDAERPLRAAAGGVDWNSATPTTLVIPYTGTSAFSLYHRGTRDSTSDDEFMVSDAAGSDNTFLRGNADNVFARVDSGGMAYALQAGFPITDTVASMVVNGAGSASWVAVGTGKTTTTSGTMSSGYFTGIRLGAYNSAPSLSERGVAIAIAFATAGHTNAEWLAMVAYVQGLSP